MTPPPPPPIPTPTPPLGPRPLGLHLLLQIATCATWPGALTIWNDAPPFWKPPWAGCSPDCGTDPSPTRTPPQAPEARKPSAALASATDREARRRLEAFLSGVERYHAAPRPVPPPLPPPVWRRGTTVVRAFPAAAATDPSRAPVLIVPSLINRARILDLCPPDSPGRSLCRHLAAQGHPVFLVDWQAPGPEEATFDLGAYVHRRLEPALAAVVSLCGRRPVVMGYCMGGGLALGLAARRPAEVRGLVLMATPWDFHATDGRLAALARAQAALCRSLTPGPPIPPDLVQIPFGLAESQTVAHKYRTFAALPARGRRARAFVAVEDWLNDGVPLAAPAAREAVEAWYQDNRPARGLWTVAGTPVRPRDLTLPALVLVPEHDRIVSPASALALAEQVPGAVLRRLPLGHVAMVAGPQAVARVYRPVAGWLARLPPDG